MRKNVLQGKSEPAQPLLPGVNLARFLSTTPAPKEPNCRGSRSHSTNSNPEAGGLSPTSVPPVSNTGVHHETSNRGAAVRKGLA